MFLYHLRVYVSIFKFAEHLSKNLSNSYIYWYRNQMLIGSEIDGISTVNRTRHLQRGPRLYTGG
ncbi:hypothetical protein EMIT0133MI5_50073 [Bacillus velezensis]|nr:protein of unknown function [Bacillus velezensis UCMB5033]